jgi:hypothetical protein
VVAALAGTLVDPLALAGEGAVTVPLEIRGNFPVITARVDGHELPLMFDLGGDFDLVLTEPALALVRTTPVEGSYQSSDVKGNIIEAPLFRVAQVDISGVVFADVTGHADRSDPSYRRTDIGDMGILGQPFFRSKKIVLDYAQRRLTIIPGESLEAEAAGCRGTQVQFLPEWEGAPVTKAVTDVGDLVMVWDTGAPVSIIRKQLAIDSHAKIADDFLESKRFMLGGTDFGPLALRAFDYQEPQGTDGFVGHSFFATHVVCVDFQSRRLLVRAR